MKFFLALFCCIIIGSTSHAQTISYDDFRALIPFLQKEDFRSAFNKSTQLLSSTIDDSSDMRGIVNYINIFSAAGMVNLKQMTYDDFTKASSKIVGHYIVMSGHPCIDSSSQGFNALQFVSREGEIQGSITSSNNAKTSILCFEYFKYAEPIDPSAFIGKIVRCGGRLTSIDVNPNRSTVWISRLHISNAFARITTPR